MGEVQLVDRSHSIVVDSKEPVLGPHALVLLLFLEQHQGRGNLE